MCTGRNIRAISETYRLLNSTDSAFPIFFGIAVFLIRPQMIRIIVFALVGGISEIAFEVGNSASNCSMLVSL